MSDLMLFTGSAHKNDTLVQEICNILGVSKGKAIIDTFSDGETRVEILENVRGRDIFIIQSTCPPSNHTVMELVILIDALKRSSAGRITAVVPYYGYARQDRRVRSSRVPISAKIVADIYNVTGADRIVTVDIHSEQIQGFFNIPMDNVYGSPILLNYIRSKSLENAIIVSPDIGGVVRARAIAKSLGLDLAIIDKRRQKANVSEVMNVIGDIKDKHCLIIDDIIDTAGTMCKAGEALIKNGAKKVSAYGVHPIFSGNAIKNIENSVFEEVVVTNTIPLSDYAKKCKKITQLSIAGLLGETIRRINNEESLSIMFSDF